MIFVPNLEMCALKVIFEILIDELETAFVHKSVQNISNWNPNMSDLNKTRQDLNQTKLN